MPYPVAAARSKGKPRAAVFSPLSISGLAAWYDLSDISTLYQDNTGTTPVTADGQSIGKILDKSGNSRHPAQSDAAKKPTYKTNIINGRAVGRGDGGDDIPFTVTIAQPFALYAVSQTSTTTGQQGIFGNVRCGYLNDTFMIYAGSTFLQSAAASMAANTPYILRYEVDGASSKIYRNGSLVASGTDPGTASFTAIRMFSSTGSNFLTGDIGEAILVAAIPAAGVAAQIESYLNSRWACF